MSWRNHDTHKAETRAVKEALRKAGINAKVGHGRGTAWDWLEINIGSGQQFGKHNHEMNWHPDCFRCQEIKKIEKKTMEIIKEVTGRRGDYHGNTLILTQDAWNRKKNCTEPINHPNWRPGLCPGPDESY